VNSNVVFPSVAELVPVLQIAIGPMILISGVGLLFRRINPRTWLHWYFEACANSGGKAPADVAEFLPWNFSTNRLSELQISTAGNSNPNTS